MANLDMSLCILIIPFTYIILDMSNNSKIILWR
jgi:hypothetical protein